MADRRRKPRNIRPDVADQLMLDTASLMVRDFQDVCNDPEFCSHLLECINSKDVARIRSALPEPTDQMDVTRFKATYQMQSVFKRYRYRTDIYSDQELEELAIAKFLETQDRLRTINLDSLSAIDQRILELARSYVAYILGPYDDEEHRRLCRFGRKASVGIPTRKACLAERWQVPLTGSEGQISWFDSEMSQDCEVQKYWAKQFGKLPLTERSPYLETDFLTLTLVPKTFKSLRCIMPNTTIGSYMSFGLGEMIRKRLRRKGYDISTLQVRHRYLAQLASSHTLWTTADLSSASDSITDALVKRLFPTDWYNILNQSRIGKVRLPDGSYTESLTFCTMGVGYTFPLQTLVFLSLLKAIQAVYYDRRDKRVISVYGDDLIYASRMHSYVAAHFQRFGFVINLDKTFHEGHFRESCGGDYYHGVDVRPFQPRNGSVTMGPKTHEAMLYKIINGLLARWSEHEVGRTLRFLCRRLEFLVGKVKLVPLDFPDDAGVKVPSLLLKYEFLEDAKCANPKHVGHGLFRFSYLRFTPELREEKRHEPYLWERLRGGPLPTPHEAWNGCPRSVVAPMVDRINRLIGVDNITSELVERDVKPTRKRDHPSGGLRRRVTHVTISNTGHYTRQSGISCFEIRRP